jgi:hypothetical protein
MSREHFNNELVPLSSAAASAYVALGLKDAPLTEGVLDVVAIALAACIPIYGARDESEPLQRLSDAQMKGGKFLCGAATLHFPSGRMPPYTRLAVTAEDLASGIECLKRAGVNFSQARFEPAPRRIPRITPA